jgi:hypothetical protein
VGEIPVADLHGEVHPVRRWAISVYEPSKEGYAAGTAAEKVLVPKEVLR